MQGKMQAMEQKMQAMQEDMQKMRAELEDERATRNWRRGQLGELPGSPPRVSQSEAHTRR